MRPMLSVVLLTAAVTNVFAQASWVVEPKPVLDVPPVSSAGTVVFGYPAGGVRLANGGLLIADRAENTVRVLDSSGKVERSLGRAGTGPGDFQSMMWVGRCGGDSLLVWDLGRRQATMVGSGSTTLRQFAVPTGDTAQVPFQFSCSPRGAIVYRSTPRPIRGGAPNSENPNIVGVNSAVYGVSRDGAIRHRYGEIPAGEVVRTTSPSGGAGAAPRPLGRVAHVAALSDVVVMSSPDSAILTFHAADGRSSSHLLPIPLRTPTQAEFDAAVEALASQTRAEMRPAMAAQLRAIAMPTRLPPISALFVDTEDLLWVQTTPPGGRVMDFLVVRPDGRVVAKAQIPRGITVFDIGRDYILGSYTDANDEMHVAVYRLRRQ